MRTFQHAATVWNDYPGLAAGAVWASGLSGTVSVDSRLAPLWSRAETRLEASTESELPEIQAWRRAFSSMGLKPTQYRCASEALLRRFRKERSLPRIHPLIDVCNAVSIAYAIPIAVLDLAHVAGSLEVRRAVGSERYLTFGGETESPVPGEVIYADSDDHAHARRWTNRQSAVSAVRPETSEVLIVAEALHASADKDLAELVSTVVAELTAVWAVTPRSALLTAAAPTFPLD